jgi:hypothetical protein
VATMHDLIQEMIRAHLTLVHVFHTYGSMDAPWVAHALSQCTPVRYDRIASVSATYKATQFGDSIYLVCASIKSNGCSSGLNRRGSTGESYHLGAPNLRSRPLSTFPSSILHFPLIAPPGLQLCQPFHKST